MADKENPAQRYDTREFRPYVIALGQLALAWNEMQDTLAEFFSTLMMDGPPREGDFVNNSALRAWNSLRSDLLQH
jgi:hypothetical protein